VDSLECLCGKVSVIFPEGRQTRATCTASVMRADNLMYAETQFQEVEEETEREREREREKVVFSV